MLDALIIGAGPAGLIAASYLGRYCRPALVIDGGDPRARWIPESHNTPGFPQGVAGPELLARLRDQALQYGAQIHSGTARALAFRDGLFQIRVGAERLQSRYVLLATGIYDKLPSLAGSEEAVRRGVLRLCPICDAFEARGRNIAVLGEGEHALREGEFLRTYSDSVTWIRPAGENDLDVDPRRIEDAGIRVLDAPIESIHWTPRDARVETASGTERRFDIVYAALGCRPRTELARQVGAQCDEHGALVVDAHQETTVPRLFAAGDVVRGLNQIVVAGAEGAIAATAIHNRLRAERRREIA